MKVEEFVAKMRDDMEGVNFNGDEITIRLSDLKSLLSIIESQREALRYVGYKTPGPTMKSHIEAARAELDKEA